jgi:hypothetical protein
MTARDDLADLIDRTVADGWPWARDASINRALADAVIAAGWTPPGAIDLTQVPTVAMSTELGNRYARGDIR